jgi:hypothetical protein
MAHPDVSFTNNLGTVTFKRCLVGVADNFEFNGRSLRKTKTITVEGYLMQDSNDPEYFHEVLTTNGLAGKTKGEPGTLVLPWAELTNIKLSNFDMPEGVWAYFQPITAVFVDDKPIDNIYHLTFFGVKLLNPRFSTSFPSFRLNDEYPQMTMQKGLSYNFNTVGAGVMRTKAPPGCMEIQLTGSIACPDGKLPDNWKETLMQRANTSVDTVTTLVPSGYPRPFQMADAVPELATRMPLTHVIVVGGRLSWRVEHGIALVTINMLCQPQKVGV